MIFKRQTFLSELSGDEKREIRNELVAIAYKQSFTSAIGLLIIACFVVYMFHGTPVETQIILWFVAAMVSLASRVWLLRRYKKTASASEGLWWELRFSLVLLLSASVWGSLGFLFFDVADPVKQYFLIFVLAGISATGSGTIASVLWISAVFSFLLLAPMTYMFFVYGTLQHHIMGGLAVLYFGMLFTGSKRIYSNILKTLQSKILHQKALKALEMSEEHFETIFKEAPAGIFYYDNDLIVSDANTEVMNMLQIGPEKMIGLNMKKLPDPSLYDALMAPINGDKGYYEGPYTSKFNKLQLWVILRTSVMYDEKRNIIGGLGIVTDITERIAAEEKMKHQAYYDALTDIPNRILLHDRIVQSLAHYHRSKSIVAVLFLDLDHFKTINDSFGHHVGDALLIEASRRLVGACREDDTVARLGGDEFVILLNDLGPDSHAAASKAETVAEKIHHVLGFPFDLGLDDSVSTGLSIGIAMVNDDEQSADDLLKFADTAMYQAKKEGRGTTRFYQEKMDQWIKKRLLLENALRYAITNQELELYYQPVIEIAKRKVIGAEALLRWNHPELGMIMPDELIGIAEESRLIIPIGDWVMEEACRQFVEWKTTHPQGKSLERIAINVSAIQFRQEDFTQRVIRIVHESGIAPSMVEIELTESIIIDRIETVIQKMEELKTYGIRISMDDFGTGYSSLAYLKRLPFSTLKIDRSFIRDIMIDSGDAALVETIISMASIFKLSVIAEGVETIYQLEFLEGLGCRYFQGYLCSKPVPAKMFESLLNYNVNECPSRL